MLKEISLLLLSPFILFNSQQTPSFVIIFLLLLAQIFSLYFDPIHAPENKSSHSKLKKETFKNFTFKLIYTTNLIIITLYLKNNLLN